ncbi:MAG: hypothetical protein ACI9UQ_001356 [Candidatus Krumholzibacteriia bacterium]
MNINSGISKANLRRLHAGLSVCVLLSLAAALAPLTIHSHEASADQPFTEIHCEYCCWHKHAPSALPDGVEFAVHVTTEIADATAIEISLPYQLPRTFAPRAPPLSS